MPRRTKASMDAAYARVKNIFSGHRRRAKKYGREHEINYSEADLRSLITPLPVCPYCGRFVGARDYQVDHRHAISRGGSFRLDNLQVTCGSCNRRKGCLSDIRYRSLLNFISQWDEADRRDLLMRLAAGGAWASRRGFYTVS